jgi:polysaccharide biosynthesis/export protein
MLNYCLACVLALGLLFSIELSAQDAKPADPSATTGTQAAPQPASATSNPATPSPVTAPQQVQPLPERVPQTPASEAPGVVEPSPGTVVRPIAPPLGGDPLPDQTGAPAIAAATPVAGTRQAEVVIGSGDLLVISVYGAPDYHYEVRVDSRGNVNLPLAGAVALAGLTVTQAQEQAARKLSEKGIFNDPQVSVFEKEYATQGITMLGEIQKPGIYPLMGPRTVSDVISAAGGLTPRAGDTARITHRDRPENPQTIKLNGKSASGPVEAGGMAPVRPGDTVVIAKAGIVYVVGDVKEPAGFVMENNSITVLQAMAMAHGANPTAKLSASKLIRSTPNGPQEVPVQLGKILSAKLPDITLQPGDILFIPNSKAKTLTHKSLDAILSVAAAAAIYH